MADARPLKLSLILASLAGPSVTVGDVLDRTAHAGFGCLLALLGLAAIPFPGLSMPFGLAVAVLGAQLLVGREQPWLPAWLRKRALPARVLRWLHDRLARFAGHLERAIKPRLARAT